MSARADSVSQVAVTDLGVLDYEDAWERQRAIATDRADGTVGDQLLLTEHPSVFTAGRRTQPQDRPTDGARVIETDRGGKITWHGPGQLVGYPIIKLAEPVDVVKYVRRLEEALISTCASFGVRTGRVEGRSGVWLPAGDVDGQWRPERKIAALGIRVARGVTLHGFSLNCNNNFEGFSAIVPCGIPDAGVTSLTVETGTQVRIEDVRETVVSSVLAALDGTLAISTETNLTAPPTARGVASIS